MVAYYKYSLFFVFFQYLIRNLIKGETYLFSLQENLHLGKLIQLIKLPYLPDFFIRSELQFGHWEYLRVLL